MDVDDSISVNRTIFSIFSIGFGTTVSCIFFAAASCTKEI